MYTHTHTELTWSPPLLVGLFTSFDSAQAALSLFSSSYPILQIPSAYFGLSNTTQHTNLRFPLGQTDAVLETAAGQPGHSTWLRALSSPLSFFPIIRKRGEEEEGVMEKWFDHWPSLSITHTQSTRPCTVPKIKNRPTDISSLSFCFSFPRGKELNQQK